ncbi:enolase C-terminal domain-like protein [Rhodohalobacter halophilus]|uniref:enolase C-terminal domain-like protein n=1 Tax=Rhodohalobacter halophilus TaxID=1812810 RepID=UPI00083F6010
MLELYSYRLPFKKPFQTGSANFTHRVGVLIYFSDGSSEIISEAAPLPGFSTESLLDVIELLKELKSKLKEFFVSEFTVTELNNFIKKDIPYPSVAFAISYMGLHLISKRKQISIGEIFESDIQKEVIANDVIAIGSTEDSVSQFKRSFKKGFRTFKIKADQNPRKSIELLEVITDQFDRKFTIRIDANRSWTEHSFLQFAEQLSSFPIEYIEEPFSTSGKSSSKKIIQTSSVPIAFDESIEGPDDLARKLGRFKNEYFVIKPMRIGCLSDLFETIRSHRTHFNRVVVTTMLESAIGRAMTLTVASLIGDPSLAHGLNTGSHLMHDLYVNKDEKPALKVPDSGFIEFTFSEINNEFLQQID